METNMQESSEDALATHQGVVEVRKNEDADNRHRSEDALATHQGAVEVKKLEDAEHPHRSEEVLATHQGAVEVRKLEDAEDLHRDRKCILAEQGQHADIQTKGSDDKSRNQECLHSQQEPNADMKAKELDDESREKRRLLIENQYLKLILDRIHRKINVGEATSNIELKPPEDLENDQSIKELTTNIGNVELKFYDLEWELDYIHVKISELANMIAGGEGSDVTLSPEKTNQCKALGLKPRSNPAEANKQSERSLKLDKDLELVTSAWRDMKEKNTEEIKRLNDWIQYLDSVITNLYDHVVTGAEPTPEGSDQPPESSFAKKYQYIQDIHKKFMNLESENKKYAETNFGLEEILAALDSYCSSKIETKDNLLGEGNQFASRCSREYERAKHIADRFKEMKIKLSGFEKSMEEKTKEYQKTLAKEEKSNAEIVAKLRKTQQALNDKSETLKKLQAKHETLQIDHTNVNREKSILEDKNRKIQYSISCLQQEKVDMDGKYQCMIEKQNDEITRLRQAEESLLTRLSKIAGDRFTHDNVNIADLSDADRPTKLSETYSELYDNEWTDAFEELTENMKLSDEAAISFLLKVLMNAFHKCKEITWDRYESLKLVASTLDVKQEKLSSMLTEEKQNQGTDNYDGKTTSQHETRTNVVGTIASGQITSESPDADISDGKTSGQYEVQNEGEGTASSDPTTIERPSTDQTDRRTNVQHEEQNKGFKTTASENPYEDKSDATITGQHEDQNEGVETTSSPTTSEHPDKSDRTTKVQPEDQHKGVGTTASNITTSASPDEDKSDVTITGQHENQNEGVGITSSSPTTSEHPDKSDGTTKVQPEDQNKGVRTTASNPTTLAPPHEDKFDGTFTGQHDNQNEGVEITSSSPSTSEPPTANISDGTTTGQHEDQNEGAGTTSSSSTTSEICLQLTSLTSTLSIDQEKSLKNIWRATTIYLKDESLKLLCANLITCLGKPETDMPKTSKYLTCCTELCWKMGVQEKPMHLDVNAEKEIGQEKQFDTDKFRAYTKSGKSVAYVVWPALLLHEGGAMLAKGIAQGCQKRVSSKE